MRNLERQGTDTPGPNLLRQLRLTGDAGHRRLRHMAVIRLILCLPTLAWLLLVPPGMCFCEVAALVGLPRACQGPASTDFGHPDSEKDHEHSCPKVKDPTGIPPHSHNSPMPVLTASASDGVLSVLAAVLAPVRPADPDPGGWFALPRHLILRAWRN
ncbi:MAG: hypothetical protein NZM31_14315 [Gemmatales bacterium]|nr:hypothetical protein [Gemmatales bacterium]MDW8388170.1 hypothetical protein [Gemmatales bacterium]